MKSYPSIPSSVGTSFFEMTAHVFDKIDGSNLRFEWTAKSGWYKYGTRNRLFDETDEVFGTAIELWKNTSGAELEKVALTNKWKHLLAFAEFHGPNSFAGYHDPADPKQLTIFDIAVNKQGFLDPRDFLAYCGHLNIPRYLGKIHWTRDFVECVKKGEVEGITFEGVVGKTMKGKELLMSKAKTQKWLDAVHAKFDPKTAANLI